MVAYIIFIFFLFFFFVHCLAVQTLIPCWQVPLFTYIYKKSAERIYLFLMVIKQTMQPHRMLSVFIDMCTKRSPGYWPCVVCSLQTSEEDTSQFDVKFTRQTPVDSPDDTVLSDSINQVFKVILTFFLKGRCGNKMEAKSSKIREAEILI